jgi:hypothetical protein
MNGLKMVANQGDKMKLLHEHALPATIYRVSELEKRTKELEDNLKALNQIIYTLRSDIIVNKALGKQPELPIGVPEELKMKRRTRSGSPRGNRRHETVKKRWSLWKIQYESGMSMKSIANEWDCDHSSISYARSREWNPTKATPKAHVIANLIKYNRQ